MQSLDLSSYVPMSRSVVLASESGLQPQQRCCATWGCSDSGSTQSGYRDGHWKVPIPIWVCGPLLVGEVYLRDSQMKLINLAPGHPPRCKSHPQVCGGLLSHFHAPIPSNNERKLPVREPAAAGVHLAHVRDPVGHGFANEADKPCPWTSPKK